MKVTVSRDESGTICKHFMTKAHYPKLFINCRTSKIVLPVGVCVLCLENINIYRYVRIVEKASICFPTIYLYIKENGKHFRI